MSVCRVSAWASTCLWSKAGTGRSRRPASCVGGSAGQLQLVARLDGLLEEATLVARTAGRTHGVPLVADGRIGGQARLDRCPTGGLHLGDALLDARAVAQRQPLQVGQSEGLALRA